MTALQLAVTTQQRVGIAVVAAIVLGWGAYLLLHLGREKGEVGDEIELAPNRRPYLDDDGMEGPRLNKVLGWSLVLMAITAAGLPLYWLDEPSRQAGAVKGFDDRAAGRGAVLFQPVGGPLHEGNIGSFGCGGCHGAKGEGGVTEFAITDYLGRARLVDWKAPALDTVLKRFSEEEVEEIIVYGRANTPMPAWGTEGGGPMNAQQITDLVEFIKRIQISDDEARERARAEAEAEAKAQGKSPDDGGVLFNVNCARCHTKGWSHGEPETAASGAFGPSLLGGQPIRQFPSLEDHFSFLMNGSEFGKPYGTRGVGTGRMPGFSRMLTPEQIRAIVEYERSLP